jgi:hypothetical protein
MEIRSLFFAVMMFFSSLTGFSQSLVGTWKRISMVLVDKDNVSADLQTKMTKALPCSADVTYTFLASGIQKANIPDDCKKRLASMAAMFAEAKYELNGTALKIFSAKKEISSDAVYQVSFKGSTMTWIYDYLANPKVPNPTKAKKIVIVYQKL